jgi:hypothetical protein
MRTVGGEDVSFFVHCWGAAGTTDPVDDYDVTRALVHAVRAAVHRQLPGAYQIEESGKYRPGSNLVRLGRWYTFGLTVFTPVLATLRPYDRARQYAPDDVTAEGEHKMKFPDGTSQIGCT